MPLVTDADVKVIIDTDRDTTEMIATADLIITEDFASSGLSTARKTRIELYLAAHFVAITEERGGLTRSKLGDVEESVANNYGQGLHLTRYGQQALALDSSGTLQKLSSNKKRASFSLIEQYARPVGL